MHAVTFPRPVVDRVVARHGREHVFDDLDPSRTALVVVDLQIGYLLPGVAHSPCDAARDIIPEVNRLARAVRRTGGTVVWVQTEFVEDEVESWSTLYDMVGVAGTARRRLSLSADGPGYPLWPALETRPEDLRVAKRRYSAFIQGSSDLEEELRARSLDTVLIAGTLTNVCCESTARDAMMRNFKSVMISDANAARTLEDHDAALRAFYLAFGDVMSTDFAIACLERGAAASRSVLRGGDRR